MAKDWKELLLNISDYEKFNNSLYPYQTTAIAAIHMVSVYIQMEKMSLSNGKTASKLGPRSKSKQYREFISKLNDTLLDFFKSLGQENTKDKMKLLNAKFKESISKISPKDAVFESLNSTLENAISLVSQKKNKNDAYNLMIQSIEASNLPLDSKKALTERAGNLWWFSNENFMESKQTLDSLYSKVKN